MLCFIGTLAGGVQQLHKVPQTPSHADNTMVGDLVYSANSIICGSTLQSRLTSALPYNGYSQVDYVDTIVLSTHYRENWSTRNACIIQPCVMYALTCSQCTLCLAIVYKIIYSMPQSSQGSSTLFAVGSLGKLEYLRGGGGGVCDVAEVCLHLQDHPDGF